jgi:uncharacterized membrane protein
VVALGVPLALLASVGHALSDVLSGTVVRHATASLALWAQVTGLVLLSGAAAARGPEVSGPGVSWGVCAGVVGALGVLAFYTALQRGRTSVVAPVAGAGTVLPVLAGVLGGDALSWRSGLGVVAATLGILVLAAAADTVDVDVAASGRLSRSPAGPSPCLRTTAACPGLGLAPAARRS